MTGEPADLRRVQRWMQTVIMHRDGVAQGIDSAEARGLLDVSSQDVETVIARSSSQTSIERLQVYANAYYARLLECLRLEFPAQVCALGEELFDGFAFGYLQAYPSQSYTLAMLGANFPRYLEETRPALGAGKTVDWPDFLIDLARLERGYSEVFDGPGNEGETLLAPADLLAVSPDALADVKLVPAACLRLMQFRFPVHEYATAVRNDKKPSIPNPQPTWLAITRRDYIVRRVPVSQAQYELLQGLLDGETLGAAIERAASFTETGIDEFAARLSDWFREWAQAQFFRAIEGK